MQPLDFQRLARQEMLREGFQPDFPSPVLNEVRSFHAAPGLENGAEDLRGLLWSSIDNTESRDLDQIEWAEQLPDGKIRILVGIADVDAAVSAHSATDAHARANGTSVYPGGPVFAMLPERLSTDLTSLGPDADRRAMVMEWVVERDGQTAGSGVRRALVRWASPGGARSGVPESGSVGAERRFGCEACGRPSGVAPAPAGLVSGVSNGDASVAGAGVLPRAAGFLRPGAAPPPLSGLSISKGERSSGGGFGIAGLPPGAAGPGVSSPSPSPEYGLGPSIGFFFNSSLVLGPSGLRKAQPSGNLLHRVGKYP